MLDGLLGRGFSSKCKSLIKQTKSRIDVLRRKKNATLKFLKKDIADLLANGLDINAYGRAAGLLDEMRLSWNLDFVEECCNSVLKQLSDMQKQRECPEEARMTVSSLMYAAGGFSELPELRELRHIFYERYEDSLELFVNQEFVTNLSSKPFSTEKKIKLMEDIASEFSIPMDAQAFKQMISKPNAHLQNQPKQYGSSHDDKSKMKNVNDSFPVGGYKHDVSSKDKNDKYNLKSGKDTVAKDIQDSLHDQPHKYGTCHAIDDKYKLKNIKDYFPVGGDKHYGSSKDSTDGHKGTVPRGHKHDVSSKAKLEHANDGKILPDIREETLSRKNNQIVQSRQEIFDDRQNPRFDNEEYFKRKENHMQGKKPVVAPVKEENTSWTDKPSSSSKRTGRHNTSAKEIVGSLSNGSPDITPYAGLQFKNNNKDRSGGGGSNSGGEYDNAISKRKGQEEDMYKPKPYLHHALPPPYVKPNAAPKDSKPRASHAGFNGIAPSEDPLRHPGMSDLVGHNHPNNIPIVGPMGNHNFDQDLNHHEPGISNPLPKPRSLRRKHSKSSSHDGTGNADDIGVAKQKSRSKRRDHSRQGLQILFDDDHQQIDEEERIIDKMLLHYSKKPSFDEKKVRSRSKSRRGHYARSNEGEAPRDKPNEVLEINHLPTRSISLPREQQVSSETKKVFARAASFQPDRSNEAQHVHPKLPDYDDLAARFASLKGR